MVGPKTGRGSPSCKLRPGMNKAEMNVAVCLHRRAIDQKLIELEMSIV